MENLKIKNLQDCAAFIYWIGVEKGCIYNPCTPASDYVSLAGGNPTFTPQEAAWMQQKIDAINNLCESIGMDPHDLAYEVFADIGTMHRPDPTMRELPPMEDAGEDIDLPYEVEEISFARAMRLHHRGVEVYWVDKEGHESLCRDEETIIEKASHGAWFFYEN